MTTAQLMSILTPLPAALPLAGAALTLVLNRHAHAQRIISVAVLSIVVAVAGALLYLTDQHGVFAISAGGWSAPLGITLVVDRLAALMLLVSATVTLGVLVYSVGQGTADGDEETPVSIYHPTYLVLSAGVATAFLAGDLFNLYVGFEVLLAASYVLLTLGGTESRVRAGVTYVIVSLVSSVLFLSAIALIYGATGTVNLAQLAGRLDALPDDVRMILHLVLLIAFGIKAAVFPLSFWLPDSYPTAPAPVTAVFAGLLTKVGVYAIIRTETLLFPGGDLSTLLLIAALMTLVVGILGAVAQSGLKRLLSFTLVSHIGYMVFGVALGSVAGMSGAVFYVVHHITIQTALFLTCGLIERRGGTTAMPRLGGLARLSPVLAVLYFIPAINLAGIPPFSGFLGKLGLFQAGVADGSPLAYALVAAGAATSLLTLYAIARVWNLAFWRSVNDAEDPDPVLLAADGEHDKIASAKTTLLPRSMVGATAAMAAVGVALAVAGGPLWGVTNRAATDLIARTPFVEAVFPPASIDDHGVPLPRSPR